MVGVDPVNDEFFLPPPGLTSLEPLEPSPTRWLIKNFAAPRTSELQFDPGLGLDEDMLVEIAGSQYRISNPRGDLATIQPAVPPGDGFASGTPVGKVEAFRPFDGARNQQDHILYLGHAELLNVEAEANIEVSGLAALEDGVAWEYWGKDARADPTDADPRWRPLEPPSAAGDKLVLTKQKGAVEPTKVGTAEARWIRARLTLSDGMLTSDRVALSINPLHGKDYPGAFDQPAPTGLPPVEVMVNSTPSPPRNFYPLGREPHMFDTLYLGCAEAFSKPGAKAWVKFDLSDGVFSAMSAIDALGIGRVVAGVDKSGTLHLLSMATDGTVTRLAGHEPMTPAEGVSLITTVPPVMWMEGSVLNVAVATADKVFVWKEVAAAPTTSAWADHGSPPGTILAQAGPIAGLVLVDDGGTLSLIALRDGKIAKQAVTGNSWTEIDAEYPAGTECHFERIFQIASDGVPAPKGLLAMVEKAPGDLIPYNVTAQAFIAAQLIAGVDKDVRPFGMESGTNLEVVAAKMARMSLLARSTGAATIEVPLGQTLELLPNAAIGGRLEDAHVTAYAIAAPNGQGYDQELIAWRPFAAASVRRILFRNPIGSSIGVLRGSVTIFEAPGMVAPAALLPGNNKGEIFAAWLGGNRASEQLNAADLRSAISVPPSPPVVEVGDTVAAGNGGQPDIAIVVGGNVPGQGSHVGRQFFWLDTYLDRSTDETVIQVYKTSTAAPAQLTVSTNAAPYQLTFAGPVATLPDWILIDDGAGTPSLVGVTNFVPGTNVVTVDRLVAPLNSVLDFWLPTPVQARLFPGAILNATNNVNWTVAALEIGAIYFPDLNPVRQKVVAYTQSAGHAGYIAFASQWNPAPPPPGVIKFTVDGVVTGWAALFGDSTANPALSWEYWNGTGWWLLPVDEDGTGRLRNSGWVKFVVPTDLKPVDWAGKTNHWIRARLIGGDYGREKVVVITRPIPGTNQTEQTVNRTTEGIQPPFALEVRIAYAVDQEVAPTFLLTLDSGTLRDQSDANRMSGTNIEVFAPLGCTLGRFEAGDRAQGLRAETAAKDRGCDDFAAPCTCCAATPAGQADLTGRAVAVGQGGGRALYLGFTSKLSDEPVNLLFVVEQERPHDASAPMEVHALIGDRLVPVLASDETRALSESGLVKMSFSVEPMQAELFGRNLFWLRLTPRGSSDWLPALKGVYLNAVWARAAETMTRELVGSSAGEPGLTLALARPPLLQDSLELRVREPLGGEERDRLLAEYPDSVVSDAVDLPGDWVLWRQVIDPADCAAADRVYALDEATGTIRFGDGRHGAIPSSGPDTIVAFRYERTEPGVGEAVPANQVVARTPLNLVTPVDNVEAVYAGDQPAGGLAPQSDARVLQFSPARLRHRGRALSARDIEDLALEWSADAVQARCFPQAGRVTLVLVMRGRDPQPSRAEKRELTRALLAAAPPTLAVPGRLIIEGPTVRRIRIKLRLVVPAIDLAGAVGIKVKSRLRTYFDTDPAAAGGWQLGATPGEDDIAEALLDVANLESIAAVAISEVDDSGVRPWSAKVGARALALLDDDGVQIEFDVTEAVA
ncbi:mlr6562 [Mesorhizobium japonicum MAFF 303099]|uniref:Mlr6562 protein n=1 Tax=Mesorhizobium japonicum (strain LMG 29417 / CECT 9101 / MAFF 303099) TaxID=266835 RepID=Q988W7_RHILO|nr:mlr6562 [Mesorhizobium japonicum MAFF 303099]